MIIIFGGTFNPIHRGHQEIIESLNRLDDVEEILIIPTKIPPHKTVGLLADEQDRVNLCSIIATDYDNAQVCTIELERKGKSYTIDTLHTVRALYPDSDIAITIGADMVVTFDEWKDYKEIVKLSKIITFRRGDTDLDKYEEGIRLLKQYGAEVIEISDEITDISSTKIRDAIQNKEDVSKYLDKRVENYIKSHDIYGE